MADFNTVEKIISEARVHLQDRIRPFRYEDSELVSALNASVLEARRLRPDLFVTRFGQRVPQYEAVTGEPFCVEPQFRMAFSFGVVAYALMRDQEDVQDARSNSFLAKFHDLLVGVRPAPLAGAAPRGRG